MTFKPTETFWRKFYALSPTQKQLVREKWEIFKVNPFDPDSAPTRFNRSRLGRKRPSGRWSSILICGSYLSLTMTLSQRSTSGATQSIAATLLSVKTCKERVSNRLLSDDHTPRSVLEFIGSTEGVWTMSQSWDMTIANLSVDSVISNDRRASSAKKWPWRQGTDLPVGAIYRLCFFIEHRDSQIGLIHRCPLAVPQSSVECSSLLDLAAKHLD